MSLRPSLEGFEMYKGFDVRLDDASFSEYLQYGRELHAQNKREVNAVIESFKGESGNLIASKIVADWFPAVKKNVFLSHSHKDESLVIAISGWLHHKLGLTSFIDSCIWGYSEKLLKMIDDTYCLNDEKTMYDYSSRNKSTSHVYMMLSTALAEVINNCECIFFVNTENSLTPQSYIEGNDETYSPWIYSEIAMTRLIQKRQPHEHRGRTIALDSSNENFSKSFNVEYSIDLEHLTPLNSFDLSLWQSKTTKRGAESLDDLYNLKSHIYG
jgi:hypothetical protein